MSTVYYTTQPIIYLLKFVALITFNRKES